MGMSVQCGVLVVVEPGSAHVFVVKVKSQWLNQMQSATGIGRQANDIARVGWNFGLDQNNMKHA
jgi:hypothetical protein